MLKDFQIICLDFLSRSVDSLNLFQGFTSREYSGRREWSLTIQRIFDSWYFGFGSPVDAGFLESYTEDRNTTSVDTSMHANIREQVNDLVRISTTCPLQDVRVACENILEDLRKRKNFQISPHPFLSPSYTFSLEELSHLKCIFAKPTEDYLLYTNYVLFCDHWHRWGRLENFVQVLGCHLEFLEPFLKVHEHLFHGDLPMPYPDRHYLAVLAAAELRCPPLVCLFVRYFISSGGNSSWVEDISKCPSRWQQFIELNRNLAHSPWKISADQIYYLTRRDAGSSRETISLSELMHAIAIITHIHALACFIYGAGIRPELDHFDPVPVADARDMSLSSAQAGCSQTSDQNLNHPASHKFNNGYENYLSTSQDSFDQSVNELLSLLKEDVNREDASTGFEEDAMVKLFMELCQTNATLTLGLTPVSHFDVTQHPVVSRFLKRPLSSGYEDFKDKPFVVSDFSWNEEGSVLVDRLAPDLGSMLDDEFVNAYDLTYKTLKHTVDVDTSPYRHALWDFVQSLFGVCHEDFRFDRVDKFLSYKQRAFLKVYSTRPYELCRLNPSLMRNFLPALTPSELVHVLIVAMEARQQASLLYALRAISQYQTRRS